MTGQHAPPPPIAINNENIVPTVKNNTVTSHELSFMKMKDHFICKAFIFTSKTPLLGCHKETTLSRSHVHDI